MEDSKPIRTIEDFLTHTRRDYEKWSLEPPRAPWYRGEPVNCQKPLTPTLYRKKYKEDYYENRLLQYFRSRSPAFLGTENIPSREAIDQWLFMARHHNLPTRLLDWTEGSLIALYFALQEEKPVVWMLNPFELNDLSVPEKDRGGFNIYGITWGTAGVRRNLFFENVNAAWTGDKMGTDFPVAIPATYINSRMAAQRSCFTIHGKKKESLCNILEGKDILKSYVIDPDQRQEMLEHLKILGVSEVTLFPEPDVLAADLTRLFRPDLIS